MQIMMTYTEEETLHAKQNLMNKGDSWTLNLIILMGEFNKLNNNIFKVRIMLLVRFRLLL